MTCSDLRLECEAVALALMDPSILDGSFVEPRHCTDARAAAVLDAAYALRSRGEAVESASLLAECDRRGHAVEVAWLLSATSTLPTNRATVAPRLRELAVARQVRAEAMRVVDACQRGDVSGALAILRKASETPDPRAGTDTHDTLPVMVRRYAETLAAKAQDQSRPALVTTGLHELDRIIAGIEYGDLTVIGGDTSVGKSSTVLLMAIEQAKRGHRPGIISVEDPRARWERRAMAVTTGVPIAIQKTRRLNDTHWDSVHRGLAAIESIGVHFEFCVGSSLDTVIAAERRLINDHGCDVVYVDYIQAIDGVHGAYSRRDEMRLILSRTKAEANRTTPASLVALSQFRKRENPQEQPSREHLYEANDIAQKAETIVLLWKDGHGVLNAVLDKAKDDQTGESWVIERDPRTGMLRPTGDGRPFVPRTRDDDDPFGG